MGGAMPDYLRSNAVIALFGACIGPTGQAHDFGQWHKTRQCQFVINSEIYQAGDVVYADCLELLDARHGIFDGAEQAAVFVVARKGKLQNGIHFLGAKALQVNVHRLFDAGGLLERRKRPRVLLDECRCAAQVLLHRLAGLFAHQLAIMANQRVEHQGHMVPGRVTPLGKQRVAINTNLARQLFDRLSEQVREYVGAQTRRFAIGVGIAGSGHPDRQLLLHRARLRNNRYRGPAG